MSEGLFSVFLKQENNKRLKLFVENPEWKKMLISLFMVASDEANRLSCSIEELEVAGQLMSPTLSNMTWGLYKKEKTLDEKFEALTARKMIIETNRTKTYTLQDILQKDMHELTMMSPGNTKQFMGCMDKIILIKGMNKALTCKFGIPFKKPDGRFEVKITYKSY